MSGSVIIQNVANISDVDIQSSETLTVDSVYRPYLVLTHDPIDLSTEPSLRVGGNPISSFGAPNSKFPAERKRVSSTQTVIKLNKITIASLSWGFDLVSDYPVVALRFVVPGIASSILGATVGDDLELYCTEDTTALPDYTHLINMQVSYGQIIENWKVSISDGQGGDSFSETFSLVVPEEVDFEVTTDPGVTTTADPGVTTTAEPITESTPDWDEAVINGDYAMTILDSEGNPLDPNSVVDFSLGMNVLFTHPRITETITTTEPEPVPCQITVTSITTTALNPSNPTETGSYMSMGFVVQGTDAETFVVSLYKDYNLYMELTAGDTIVHDIQLRGSTHHYQLKGAYDTSITSLEFDVYFNGVNETLYVGVSYP